MIFARQSCWSRGPATTAKRPPAPGVPRASSSYRASRPAFAPRHLRRRRKYLKVAPFCSHCGEALHHARSDDAPPYFVMLFVGHAAVSLALALEETLAPPIWLTLIVTIVTACALTFALLPSIKSAIVAVQWTFRMHGSDPHETHESMGVKSNLAIAPAIALREADGTVVTSGIGLS